MEFQSFVNKEIDVVYDTEIVTVAYEKLLKLEKDHLFVVNDKRQPLGVLTIYDILSGEYDLTQQIDKVNMNESNVHYVLTDEKIKKIPLDHHIVGIIDGNRRLVGSLTREHIMKINVMLQQMKMLAHQADILPIVLESAYEGIVVVDELGEITQINDAYCKLIGKPSEEILGEHVQTVIDNTNLHNTVKTGEKERGKIQTIRGQDMIVHRIPIIKGDNITGAIGMLVFEGTSELNKMYGQLQDKYKERLIDGNRVSTVKGMNRLHDMIGKSVQAEKLKQVALKVAKTNATVLITGESGTGKELYARGIHEASPFREGAFVDVNCGAIPEALFESELFGYEEGAFTGANRQGKQGKFELAQHGTLFLDEIGEMPLIMQTKLLRVLQEREYERVGGTKKRKLDARIITATNRDLRQMVAAGHFREDLFYRIHVMELHIAPLRDRRQDIPLLMDHYLEIFCRKYRVPKKQFDQHVLALCMQYDWYGNVRELMNLIEKVVVLTEADHIEVADLPDNMRSFTEVVAEKETAATLLDTLKENDRLQEKQLIIQVLDEVYGNKTAAADKLGIHRTTLYKKLRKYKIN